MKVSTVRGLLYAKEGRPASGPPLSLPCRARRLPDELVIAVRLNLEDVELRVQRIVRLRRPLEGAAEDPALDLHLLDVAEDGEASRLAAALLARLRDRGQCDLRGPVARRPEGADVLPGVGPLPRLDERRVCRDARDVRREVRHV